jgi:hypothetical protein
VNANATARRVTDGKTNRDVKPSCARAFSSARRNYIFGLTCTLTLYRRKGMPIVNAKCHFGTHAPQQNESSIDPLVNAHH